MSPTTTWLTRRDLTSIRITWTTSLSVEYWNLWMPMTEAGLWFAAKTASTCTESLLVSEAMGHSMRVSSAARSSILPSQMCMICSRIMIGFVNTTASSNKESEYPHRAVIWHKRDSFLLCNQRSRVFVWKYKSCVDRESSRLSFQTTRLLHSYSHEETEGWHDYHSE